VVCGRQLPACDEPGLRTLEQLLAQAPTAGDPKDRKLPQQPRRTRIVAWAAGPVKGRDLTYAAVMEGDLVPPGVVIADKLDGAFARGGLEPAQ
jgi:hypothetical protein